MLHMFLKKGDWFAPKRYGYGTGLPIAWQGWALLAAYGAGIAGALMRRTGHGVRNDSGADSPADRHRRQTHPRPLEMALGGAGLSD